MNTAHSLWSAALLTTPYPPMIYFPPQDLVNTASLTGPSPSTSSTWENPNHPREPDTRHFPHQHIPSALCSGGTCPALP